MKVAFDTNFLVYIEGLNDQERRARARWIFENLRDVDLIIPQQVLGELYNVLKKKAGLDADEIIESITDWAALTTVEPTRWQDFRTALNLAKMHHFQIWDACVVSVAAASGCQLLLSEDMQNGFAFGGVTIVNPFLEPLPDPLRRLLHLPH